MFTISKYKENYLMLTGGGLLIIACLTLTCFWKYFEPYLYSNSRADIFISLKVLVFLALIIAPIFEELIFRGIFSKYIFLKYFFYVGALFYIILTHNYYLLILYITIMGFNHFNFYKPIVYFCNALLFSLVHYKTEDFNLYFFVLMCFQFSIGLILTWIVLNFKFIYAILFHFIYNSILMSFLIVQLQYPQSIKFKNHSDTHYSLSWAELPLFNNEDKIIEINNNTIILKNVEAGKLFELFPLDKNKYTFNETNSFQNVSIVIIKKDSTDKKQIENIDLFNLLTASKIIKIKD